MPRKSTLTLEFLKEHLHYDERMGLFTWLKPTSNRVSTGDVCHGYHSKGYVRIGVSGERYFAHQLAWFYMTGKWVPLIDHIDGNKKNNAWMNLRHVTNAQNLQRTNRARGCYRFRNGKWAAAITVNGTRMHLGYFHSKTMAQAVYSEAKRKYHFK